jgi:hypothetical protein
MPVLGEREKVKNMIVFDTKLQTAAKLLLINAYTDIRYGYERDRYFV